MLSDLYLRNAARETKQMSEQRFQILVNGKLAEGFNKEQAEQNMATLFKVTIAKIEPMFSGRKLVIKKELNKETALKYKAAINRAGMLAAISPMEATAEALESEKKASVTAAIPDLANASLAPVGSIVDNSAVPTAPDIDTSNLLMATPGIDLDDSPPPPRPKIDTSQLSVGAVGEDVAEQQIIPEPEIDISTLSTAAVGADIGSAVTVPDANIDISRLSMAAAGEDVTEHSEVTAANIDTSSLSLDPENK